MVFTKHMLSRVACRNLLRPSGVRLQSGTLAIKIYRGEDMPQSKLTGSELPSKYPIVPLYITLVFGRGFESHPRQL